MFDGIGFSTLRHTLKTAAMVPFHSAKCCHLVSERTRSVCCAICQFLICSRPTFLYMLQLIIHLNIWYVFGPWGGPYGAS